MTIEPIPPTVPRNKSFLEEGVLGTVLSGRNKLFPATEPLGFRWIRCFQSDDSFVAGVQEERMRGILGSLFTMLACLSFGWSCACRADLILFRPAPCFGDRCVVDCGFDSGSTELLNRYEDTFAIHGIQLTGAWNHTCIIELHGSVYLGAELPVDADGSATGVELIACSIFSDPFRIVQSDIRHRVPIEELKFLDQTSLMEPSAMTPLWLATRVEAK